MTEKKLEQDDHVLARDGYYYPRRMLIDAPEMFYDKLDLNKLKQAIVTNTSYLHGILEGLGYNIDKNDKIRLMAFAPLDIINKSNGE
jgi:hypothetical protein